MIISACNQSCAKRSCALVASPDPRLCGKINSLELIIHHLLRTSERCLAVDHAHDAAALSTFGYNDLERICCSTMSGDVSGAKYDFYYKHVPKYSSNLGHVLNCIQAINGKRIFHEDNERVAAANF